MDRKAHLADSSNLQMAVVMGLVEQPRPQWDPDSESWVVLAQPRNGGTNWVLTHGNRAAGFYSWDQAREAARRIQEGPSPSYMVGRR